MATIKKYRTSDREYNLSEGEVDSTYYVGATLDIKAIYKSIARNKNTDIFPLFVEKPIFADRYIYGICIDKDYAMTVVNSDTILAMILEGDIVETD